MTRAQVRVLLVTLAVALVPAIGLATWDHWLVVHRNDDTISWSFAELLYHHIAIAAAVILEVGLVVGYLTCHLTRFEVPDPADVAERDRLLTEVAALRIRLANAQMIADNLRKLIPASDKET